MKPLVSIIIPVYNAAKFLPDTINSILNQTYRNWEVILVDDKSTDNSVEIIGKYISNNIKLIKLDKNYGPGFARNKGVDSAKGKLICFLDADDLWKKDKLEKQVNFTITNNYHFTYTSYIYSNKFGKETSCVVKVPLKVKYHDYLKNTIITTSTVMFDMCYFDKKDLYMPNLKRGEDGATWLRILKKIDYAYGLNEDLALYRISRNTLSSNKLLSIKCIWHLYRKVESLSILKSTYYFIFYTFNTIKKRIG